MPSELTPDQVLRVIAALEAAWNGDDDALAALARGGSGEQPLAVLVAEFGESRLLKMVLAATGIDGLEGTELEQAVAEYRQSITPHLLGVASGLMASWAASAGEDVRTTGDLARHVLRALLSFTGRDDPEGVRALLAHLRADALAHS
ncbi:hypothetical protein AB0F45_14915 [Streptomyces achromogenes]|uniref:hypothetical protein n=1 Tax=Streptomyces achromogenes TaxID=67255 RepID=UPI003406DDFE